MSKPPVTPRCSVSHHRTSRTTLCSSMTGQGASRDRSPSPESNISTAALHSQVRPAQPSCLLLSLKKWCNFLLVTATARSLTPCLAGAQPVLLRNHWALPLPLMRRLQVTLGIDTEMFASPLNVSPITSQYFSAFERDALFGATFDAYSHPWSGAVEFNPEYEPADLCKAVSAAIATALTSSSPFLALGILPDWHRKSYRHDYQNHPNCHILAEIAQGYFHFKQARTYPPEPHLNCAWLAPQRRTRSSRNNMSLLLTVPPRRPTRTPVGLSTSFSFTTKQGWTPSMPASVLIPRSFPHSCPPSSATPAA